MQIGGSYVVGFAVAVRSALRVAPENAEQAGASPRRPWQPVT